ncbi:hypothetical protein H4217_006788 [Coemansia sp. RSA 1939]|nr:hypothetical protein H4217_006788 [Coemansia sp. RSA 1939]
MNSKALFVKDCDDVFIQRSSNDVKSNNPTSGFRTSVYKHSESNMRVVVCRMPSPIYSAYITVPTLSVNNKGLPHALEHLVLCGSKNYPIRGYLGALAARNCSLETNGYTSGDHTEYTIFSAAEDAMANILPVFLDHVFNPLLSDSQFITEVYHYDETGKEKGVMFSEMASRENSVDFLEYYNISRLIWNSSATHSYASGGKTCDIATLTKEEVIDYHRKYYDANNVTVILTGAFTNDFEEKYLQTIPSDIITSRGCDSRAPMDCSLPDGDNRLTHKTVEFPSSDTGSTGSLSFAWRGPPHEDIETAIALEIMNEYLSGSSSSPLHMWVVGVPPSSLLATSVETFMFTHILHRLIVLDKPIGPVNAVQTINVDSGFVEMEMQIPINDIPDELRKYLVLFQSILLSAHLLLPAGIIYDDGDSIPLQSAKYVPYAEFESRMSHYTTYYGSHVGYGLLPFSFNWLDDMFVINFRAPYKRYPSAMRLTVQGIMFPEFTADSILTNAQAHLVYISERKQDIEGVLFTAATHFAGASPADTPMMNKRHMCFLAQEKFMKRIIEQIKKDGNAEDVIEKLKEIQHILIRATSYGGRGGFMALSLPSSETPEDYISIFENEWNMCYEKYAEHNGIATKESTELANRSPFPIDYASRFSALEKPLFIHVPVQSLHVSKSVFVFALDTPSCPTGKRSFDDELSDLIALDYYALWMLSEFLKRMNGPVGNAVRSKGYAYGGFLYILWESKWIALEIDYASDIVKAVDAVKQLFLDMQDNWDSYLSETDVSLARSTVIYKTTANQSTPMEMLSQTVFNSVHGFSSAEEHSRWCSTHIAAVGMSDMRRVFDKYVCRFIDDDYPMLRLLVTPAGVAIPEELGPYKQTTLEEISATYETE